MAKKNLFGGSPQKRSVAWLPFVQTLANVLGHLQEDQYLVITVKRSNLYVQFAGQGSYGMRVETPSNGYLVKSEKLKKCQLVALENAGWSAPTGTPKQSTPQKNPDGSPNYFVDFPAPVVYDRVARLTVSTLVEILEVSHPGMLEYDAFDAEGSPVQLPELGLKHWVRKQKTDRHLNMAALGNNLRNTLRATTGITTLDFNEDDVIAVRYGSAVVMSRIVDEPPTVAFKSPLLCDVEDSPTICERLNQLNCGSNSLRFFYNEGTVFGVANVPAVPYVCAQVTQSFEQFCRIADDMDDLLQSELGGHTAFQEWVPSVARH